MAHRLISQKRGKGSPTYTASQNAIGKLFYPPLDSMKEKALVCEIFDLRHDTTKTSVLAELLTENKKKFFVVAAEGQFVGQRVLAGKNAEMDIGNILPLKDVVEGAPVFNVEFVPGDGGKLCRASGTYALILAKEDGTVLLKTRSGKSVTVNENCMGTIGIAAGGGRTEKPMVKAGAKYHLMKAKKRFWPIVRGVAMNVIDHPFGGAQHHPGKSKSTSRNAPPGRKVGAIASSRTGRRKKN